MSAPGRNLYDRLRDLGVQGDASARVDKGARGVFTPQQFGAVGDGSSHPLSDYYASLAEAQVDFPGATALTEEIDGCAIQVALDAIQTAIGGVLDLGEGNYRCTYAPVISANVGNTGVCNLVIRGNTARPAQIYKVTNNNGEGSNAAPNSTATDSYVVDAVLIVKHADDVFTYEVRLENIRLRGSTCTYGLYAPRLARSALLNVRTMDCTTGILGYKWFLCTVTGCHMRGTSSAAGAGFQIANDGAGTGGGTSLCILNCYAAIFAVGFHLWGCTYSTLVGCGADSIGTATAVGTSYYAYLCPGLSIVSCGTEVVVGRTLLIGGSAYTQSVVGFRALNVTGYSASYGTVELWGGRVSFSGCYWPALETANGQYNEKYLLSMVAPVVTWDACVRPSGGAQNWHIKNDDIITTHGLRGWKTPITSGTAFQILHVWNRNVLGTGSSYYEASISGWLNIAASGRVTTGTRVQVSQMYFLTVWAWSNEALTASIQQVGANNVEGVAFTAIAVAVRAGATMNDIFLDATFTWANPDNTNNFCYWSFTPQAGATQDTIQMEAGL